MGSAKVNVALTPNGRADDLLLLHQGQDVFALPLEVDMTFEDLVGALSSREDDAPVVYLQSQGSNLTSEPALSPLCDDFSPRSHVSSTTASPTRSKDNASLSFLFATQALDKEPEAINLWVGNDRAFTSTHRDHYENLFTVVRGVKEFYLWPPAEGWALEETEPLPIYQWSIDAKESDSDCIAANALKSSDLVLRPVPSAPKTPWIRPSPLETCTSKRNAPCKRYAQSLPPLRVKVGQGQTLYLPAGWYHAVAQQVDDGQGEGASAGLCIAINQWYESDAAFSDRWAWTQFQRSLGKKLDGTFVKEGEV
ncbi:Predicted phospholipase [Ceraceosorus bombacis]|uniref:Predicted phospholipase n=1 Tax=Ceraceosorus bombacis TaxID=401625 RepID=A0A0P1BPE0_9BASI|nr:Predicted phospholipase [Ceraceosorus bombacis]